LVLFTSPTDGRDEDFNTWYDGTHPPEVKGTKMSIALLDPG
jgi:hypothetical protein